MASNKDNGKKELKPSTTWESQEDVENDLWYYSEFSQKKDYDPPMPRTLAEYRARRGMNNTERSVFDREIPEDVEYYIPGRGRAQPNRIVKPGQPIRPHPSDDEELRRKLRLVNGNLYSNEAIEQRIAFQQAQADMEAAGGDASSNPDAMFADCESDPSSDTTTKQTSSMSSSGTSTPTRLVPNLELRAKNTKQTNGSSRSNILSPGGDATPRG